MLIPIIAGLLLLWLSSTMLRQFLQANPTALARHMKQGAGFVALVLAMLLLVRGRIDLALGFGALGFWLTTGQRRPVWSVFRARTAAKQRSGRLSRVRSATIEMELDHADGAMTGFVLAGPFEGAPLDRLGPDQLRALHAFCLERDPEGARLLEAYFDRRAPGWRAAAQGHGHAGGRAGTPQGRPGSMSEDEAYELLGVAKGASREEIARAHRALMKKFHPDHGGSTDLAARVNEAKDVLMRRHPI